MKHIIKIVVFLIASFAMVSCFNEKKPNYQFMPNMYDPVGYETYGDYENPAFKGGQAAMLPPEGTIPRGWTPYDYPNTTEGLEQAKTELKNPIPVTEHNLAEGEKLYTIYCALCHGDTGDGQGILAKREKILGVPSYADAGRTITEGGVYHVQMFGINSMGSYASQTSELERWQITQHVMNLKATLKGEPLLEIVPEEENLEEESVEESHNEEEENPEEEHTEGEEH